MKEELNIMDIVDMLMRRWWLMMVSMIVVGILSFIFTEVFITPQYVSDGALYVTSSAETQKKEREITSSTLVTSQKLVDTYAEILKRRTFLANVSKDVDEKYSASQLSNMIKISSVNETEIMEISVKTNDPSDSYLIAHSVLMRAPDELIRVVEAGSVKLLDDAKKNNVAVSPNIRQNTLIGALLGIVIGALIILLLEMLDTRIKSSESITSKYNEPLLGEIPTLMEFGR